VRRRRDRRSRGLRGPLAPAGSPLARTRADRFGDLVLDAVERLERRWAQELADVEFAVETVPALAGPFDPAGDAVPLSRLYPGSAGHNPRIVLYRRPIEVRATGRADLAALVHDLIVEQVADLLGVEPETVDPEYGLD
jgi:predicted Zn-dependent protease with MMP-like domain